MNFITNKTVVKAVGFSIAVAAFLYVLITQQDSKIKDQLILNQSHKIEQLTSQVTQYKNASDSARNSIEAQLNVSIDNQHILLEYLKLQNKNYQALLSYLHSIHVLIPSRFNESSIPQLNSVQNRSSKSNKKSVKKSHKAKKAPTSCLLCLNPLVPQLPIQFPKLPIQQMLNLKQF